jgi:hypothetical protein
MTFMMLSEALAQVWGMMLPVELQMYLLPPGCPHAVRVFFARPV